MIIPPALSVAHISHNGTGCTLTQSTTQARVRLVSDANDDDDEHPEWEHKIDHALLSARARMAR